MPYLSILRSRAYAGHISGIPGHKLVGPMVSSGIFKIVGKLILHSVLNGCRGIASLSSAVKSYLLSGSGNAIPDPCLRESLNKVQSLLYMYPTIIANRELLFSKFVYICMVDINPSVEMISKTIYSDFT